MDDRDVARFDQSDGAEEVTTPAALRQPETRPSSQEQLVAEVKGIYAGLVMVESKCVEVDTDPRSQHKPDGNPPLNNEQWQALIALHRTLLHEHHDFFLASAHPSASPALRRLAAKYAMPARMWRHGIHSFLELLRRRLPASLDYMLTLLYMAYSMMALLCKQVLTFEDTGMGCLADSKRRRYGLPPSPCLLLFDANTIDVVGWRSKTTTWVVRRSGRETNRRTIVSPGPAPCRSSPTSVDSAPYQSR
jgi:hypothetical protein